MKRLWPSRREASTPLLDFVVLGGQRCGTTTLWSYLSAHPQLYLPLDKEAPFFSENHRYERGEHWYRKTYFADAPARLKRGTVTPQYMIGKAGTPVRTIADRLHGHAPRTRLVAILRDPVERAVSAWKLAARDGHDDRDMRTAFLESLDPGALHEAREGPSRGSRYIVAGEYGRQLSAYLDQFAREQLLVVFTRDLATRPLEVVSSVFRHLEVDDRFLPPDIGQRRFTGATRRLLDEDKEAELRRFMEQSLVPLPRRSRRSAQRAFNFFMREWNAVPQGSPSVALDPDLAFRLAALYEEDKRLLERVVNIEVPWSFEDADLAASTE